MVAVNNEYKLNLIAEDFLAYNLKADEVEKIIKNIDNVFTELRATIEVSGRTVDWPEFTNKLISYVRRSSPRACEDWKRNKHIRFRLREKVRSKLINYDGKRATDISTHLKMQLVDFLIYSQSWKGGYTLGTHKFIENSVAYYFVAKIIWAMDIEKTLTVETLRGSFNNYVRGSIPGFSPSVRIFSGKILLK